jgi:hypothetical protein
MGDLAPVRWRTVVALGAGSVTPQVYRSARQALVEAATSGLPIRVELTGLAVDSGAATLAMLMPYPNISIAAQQITQRDVRARHIVFAAGTSRTPMLNMAAEEWPLFEEFDRYRNDSCR